MFQRQHTSLLTKKAVPALLDSSGMSMGGQTTSGAADLYGIQPSFDIDFYDKGAGEVNIVPRIPSGSGAPSPTFTRATTATTVLANGLIGSVASGVPRSYYDPTAGTYLGYLAEGARTNLLLQSEVFDNASWTKTDTTISANAITAPDGTTTADKLTEGAAGTASVVQSVTATANVVYTFSMFMKIGNTGVPDWVALILSDGGANFVGGWFNLETGVVGTTLTGGTGASASVAIVAYPNGWYRCILTGSVGSGATAISCFSQSAFADGDVSVAINSSRYAWGAQFENNVSFASSYIPTTTAAVTRNADVLIYPTTGWLNTSLGTSVAEFQLYSTPATQRNVIILDDGTVGSFPNFISNVYVSATPLFRSDVTTTSSVQAQLNPSGTPAANVSYKLATAWKTNDVAAAVNGGTVVTDTSVTIPTVTELDVGNAGSVGSFALYGTVRRVAYYPVRAPNATLQAMTR